MKYLYALWLPLLAVIAAVLLYVLAPYAASTFATDRSEEAKPLTGEELQSAIERGRYVSIASDCVACHTAPGSGDPFAGGYPLQTPFGTIFSTNITSDKETGIGAWSEADFVAALRYGKRKDGANLYPAMPYTSYSQMSVQDMRDLWHFIRSIPPVQNAPPATSLPFPFNIRMSLTIWNWLFAKRQLFEQNERMSREWNRGAYLVNALGHCTVCHTPKNILGGDSSGFLQGGDLGSWAAPDISSNTKTGLGNWTKEQIAEYLKTGSNHVAVASGPMAEVINSSTQHLDDQDISAISGYLQTIAPGPYSNSGSVLDQAVMMQGQQIYTTKCSVCHRPDGRGFSGRAAGLAANPNISGDNPASLINTVLYGGRGVSTERKRSTGIMPPFGRKLTDQEVAAVLTYIRNSWGNAAPPVGQEEVSRYRERFPR